MTRYGVYLLCFLCVCNLVFFSSISAQASSVSRESDSYHSYLKGLLFDESGDYEQARNAYQKAIKSDFGALDIHYRLALDYVRLRDFNRAEEEFSFILKSRPYDERVRFLLALAYSYRAKYKEAIAEHLKLLEKPLLELKESDIRYSLAQIYFEQKDLDKAETEYKTILEKNPEDSNAHFYLGYIYNESSKTESAISEFRRAIELDSANSLALNSLSYVYAQQGQNLDDALVLIQKALEFEPSNGAYLDTRGWIYFKKGDLEKAIKYLENASVMLQDPEVFEHLGDVYLKINKPHEARKNWQKSLSLDPKRKSALDKIKDLKEK